MQDVQAHDERVMQLQTRLNMLVDELLVQAREEHLGLADASMGTFDGELLLPELSTRADLLA